MRSFSLTLFLSLIIALATATHAADWASLRGPDGLGVSSEKNLPTQWSKDKNIAWKLAPAGKGSSSPIIFGNQVYLTSQTEGDGLHVIAINAESGEVIWDREIGKGRLAAHKLHNMATPTPVTDGKHIWAMFGTGDLVCLDQSGKVVWQRNLVKEYGTYKTNHGYGPSPMLDAGRLYITCMHQGPSYVLAIDSATGKNLWKKDRTLEPKDESQDSYSSPIFARANGHTEMIIAGAESINAYDLASGEQLWIMGGFKVPHPYGRTISGPTAGEGVIVNVASGFQNRGYMVALKAGGKGTLKETDRLWTSSKFAPDCPTPVIYNGKVFAVRDDGMASCLDLKTGEPHWQERLFSANVKVSPVAADGKVYFLSGQANCYVIKASEKLEVLSTNELNEFTQSTPAISNGKLFIRTEDHLYCVGK